MTARQMDLALVDDDITADASEKVIKKAKGRGKR
jgi:hypothetical protein